MDVTDPAIDKSSRNAWNRDGIELFFDEDFSLEYSYGNEKDAFQYRFTGLSADGAAAETSEFVAAGSEAATRYAAIANNIKYVVTKTGYAVECAIPFYKTPAKWQFMGFDITVMDCAEGSRNNEIWFTGANKSNLYQEPSLFGKMKLAGLPGEVEATPTPAPTSTSNPAKSTATPDGKTTADSVKKNDSTSADVATGSSLTIAAPKNLKAVLKSKKVKLSWKKVKKAFRYVIYRSNTKKGVFVKIKTVKKNKYVDKKIKKKKKYYYKVQVIKKIDGKKVLSKLSKAVKAKK